MLVTILIVLTVLAAGYIVAIHNRWIRGPWSSGPPTPRPVVPVTQYTGPSTQSQGVRPRWFDGHGARVILSGSVLIGGIWPKAVSDPAHPYTGGEYFAWLASTHPAVGAFIQNQTNDAQAGAWIGRYIREHNLGDGTEVLSTADFWEAFEAFVSR